MGIVYSIVWGLGWIFIAILCEAKVAWIYNEKSYSWRFAKQMLICAIYNLIGCLILDIATVLWVSAGSGAI